jgi:glycosyltransferase involved in cell wall biosynthesis
VYNGEAYLEECIQSVLNQTYQDWEYVIVNNCSTDNSLNIARKYAKHDDRIQIRENSEFLTMVDNFNHSLRQISYESKYCKVIHSDDLMFPGCIEKMVSVAESDSSIGIVSSYRLRSNKVGNSGLQYPQTVFSGKEICRRSLDIMSMPGRIFVFGSPSSLLIRSDLIRNHDPFYNAKYRLVIDQEVCYYLLQNSNFGFVHQVLTYSRVHENQVSTETVLYNRQIVEELMLMQQFSPIYLSVKDSQERFDQALEKYYKFIAKSIVQSKNREFWKFHKRGFEKLGVPLNRIRLLSWIIEVLLNIILHRLLHPQKLIKRLIPKLFFFKKLIL